MKRLLSISAAFFYLVLSTGVHAHVDKCCGAVQSAFMMALATDCCADEALQMPNCVTTESCGDHSSCPTEEINIQLEAEFTATNSLTLDVTLGDVSIDRPAQLDPELKALAKVTLHTHDPPLPQPVYILHSSLVYYG